MAYRSASTLGEFDRHRSVGQQKTENKNKQKLCRNFGERTQRCGLGRQYR